VSNGLKLIREYNILKDRNFH